MSTRFKGATTGEILTQATVLNQDMIQTRHAVGNAMEDSDKGLPLAVIQASPVASCSSSASTINKTATVQNFPDFTLINGREVIVYMANGNSASEPTMNINNTGNILMETSYWNAGTFLKLRYVEIGSDLKRWLVDQGATNVATQLNGALANFNAWKNPTKYTQGTGRLIIPLENNSLYIVSSATDIGGVDVCTVSVINNQVVYNRISSTSYVSYSTGELSLILDIYYDHLISVVKLY